MLSTSTLELEAMPGNISDRPRAVRFEAGVGDEIIDFEPAVLLEGKVIFFGIESKGTLRCLGLTFTFKGLKGASGGVSLYRWVYVRFLHRVLIESCIVCSCEIRDLLVH